MSAATKKLITNYTFFVNSSMAEVPIIEKLVMQWTGFYMIEPFVMKELNHHVFYQFEKQDDNDKFLKSTLTISDKY